jgi:AAHS family 3-hydroxyphenylpropionic acid transporter
MPRSREIVSWLAIATCFFVAIFEGLDIQSMGVAAPHVAPLFQIGPAAMGLVLSASTFGLMIGAGLGGWASDAASRRSVLLFSMVALGIFSWGTSLAKSYDSLLLMRLFAGLGLGGVFPNLIAISAEVAPAPYKTTALGLVYCGMPLGGAAAAWLSGVAGPDDWAIVFRVGGIGSFLLLPLIWGLIPAYRPQALAKPIPYDAGEAVAGRFRQLLSERARTTLLLWVSYFFTLLAVYLLLNWLPSMLVGRGLSKLQAAHASLMLNLGAVVASLILGRMVDYGRHGFNLAFIYAGMVASLLSLVFATGAGLYWAAFATGAFVIGGQLVLYALGAIVYPVEIRGTGVGAAVAVGRAGSVLGPLLAGLVLAQGFPAKAVPVICIPGILVAFAAALALVCRLEAPKA